jgi:hypothetical protein
MQGEDQPEKAHLVQILLPLWDNAGQPLPSTLYAAVRHELVETFGGLTAYARSPAEGVWKPDDDTAVQDRIIVFEVMVQPLRLEWWRRFRVRLEQAFRQERVVIRAQQTLLL